MTSSPRSNFLSNSLAFIDRHLLWSRASHGNDPDVFTSIGDHARPVATSQRSYHQKPRFVCCSCRNLHKIRIVPQRLRRNKIDSMLLLVNCTLLGIELKLHSIFTIPYLYHP